MRNLRSPVFLHVDGGGILINLIVWLGEREAYGQNVENMDLPVKQCRRLRVKCGKLEFARKTMRAITGKMPKTGICP
ncbi:hypothetical protein [uncultured Ligilactobacillus sp.]|uniref:hypothetical protein n=1 Tax=uncultured Ligilactobacillus sp. TaxID=2837633 RepID=UPI00259B6292|nr:hypothetical protein [uncultured Ligilactobacillus sp.]